MFVKNVTSPILHRVEVELSQADAEALKLARRVIRKATLEDDFRDAGYGDDSRELADRTNGILMLIGRVLDDRTETSVDYDDRHSA